MRVAEPDPEEEGPTLRGVEKAREGGGEIRRVPLELLLPVGPVMRLLHVLHDVPRLPQVRRNHALPRRERHVEILRTGRVWVLPGEDADARRGALRDGEIGVLHPQPLPGKPVDARGAHGGTAVGAEIPPPTSSPDEDDDVRALLGERATDPSAAARPADAHRLAVPSRNSDPRIFISAPPPVPLDRESAPAGTSGSVLGSPAGRRRSFWLIPMCRDGTCMPFVAFSFSNSRP
jgi:hypothetical protein